MYLLDTNICIYYLKGLYNLDQKIRSVNEKNCFISELTVAELKFGVENSSEENRESNRQKVDHLINLFQILPINTCFDIYAKEKTRLKKSGNIISEFDLLIGCTSISYNMIMVTKNIKHFEKIENIKLENWAE